MRIEERLIEGRLLGGLTTFGIGGAARYYLEALTESDAREAFAWAKRRQIRVFILGKGSNSLFSEQGFDGLVLHNKIDTYAIDDTLVSAGAGASFSLLGARTARLGLSGLEFASGIPASVGGAVFMNAGANGRETCETLQQVRFLEESGSVRTFERGEMEFSYRISPFQRMKGCVLSASFRLEKKGEARLKQLEIVSYRLKTQPTQEKSAGCVFRNPAAAISAGALIDRCGLKGLCRGGAKVSETHANFIVNAGGATASDVVRLMEEIQEAVFAKTGVRLEPEIRIVE